MIKVILGSEFFKYIISSFIGAGIVAIINIKYTKKMNMKMEYKINTYREFFMAIDNLYNHECDEAYSNYSSKRNLLMIYSSDDFLDALIEFEKNGLNIVHEEQTNFDKALYKLVQQARVELGNKKNSKNKWSKYFYFARFNKNNEE